MTAVTHDAATGRGLSGLALAVVSAGSFGLSGALARGMIEAGWTPGSAVLVRIWVGAVVLLLPGLVALRGRWHLLRRHRGLLLGYGLAAVAVTQLCYFNAVAHMQVGPALLVEYTAPVAVVGWVWLRHGHRPGRLTVLGAAVAAAGLVLVLDLVSGAEVSAVGIAWALGAMVGVSVYFIASARQDTGLPPLTLAAGGLVVGALVLTAAGASGLMPMGWSTREVPYATGTAPWWLPVLALGVVTAALAYVTGIAATRRLGSRLASFVGLSEVLAALAAAWLLLGELPGPVQLAGGVLVLAGVVLVKLGERPGRRRAARVSARPAGAGTPPGAAAAASRPPARPAAHR